MKMLSNPFALGRVTRQQPTFGSNQPANTKEALLGKLHQMLTPADQAFKNNQAAFRERNGVDEYLGTNPQLLLELIDANGDANMAFYKSASRMRLIEGIITEVEADKITLPQLSNLVHALTLGTEDVSPFRLAGILDEYLVANGHEPQCYI